MKGDRDMRRQVSYVSLFTVLLLAAVILMSGCSTLPPVKPIKDFKDIAGTWEGSFINFASGGRETLGTRTITADGTHTTKMGVRVINEKLKLTKDGKAVNPRDGTFTLHEGGGERVLSLRYPHGGGRYTPIK